MCRSQEKRPNPADPKQPSNDEENLGKLKESVADMIEYAAIVKIETDSAALMKEINDSQPLNNLSYTNTQRDEAISTDQTSLPKAQALLDECTKQFAASKQM